MAPPVLLLVDASSYLYRAFHALPDLRNHQGEPTGALVGVLNMLRRLESDFKTSAVLYKACVFDAKGKTFREDWYPQYKANRPPMPDELVRQVEPLHAAIRALGWPLLAEPGVEADDVLGTLARKASARGIDVVISTGDKDLAQLVSPQVRLVNTMTRETLDEAGVFAKFGVMPTQMVDFLSLMGDSADNVPGVAKVGPKTAVKWLSQYGSLANLLAHADEVGGVVGNNLRQARDFLPLAQRLVTVCCDVPLALEPESLTPQPIDREVLLALFTRYELKSWLQEFSATTEASLTAAAVLKAQTPHHRTSTPDSPKPTPPALDASGAHRQGYETLLTWPQLERWRHKIEAAALTALDTETTALDPFSAQIVGISLAVAAGEACYIPLAHSYAGVPTQLPREAVLAYLKPWLESPDKAKLGQHLKYDQHVLANQGIRLAGVVHDTLLASYVLESAQAHDLGQLARRHLGLETLPYEALCGKGAHQISFDQVDITRAAEYAAEDADLTWRLHQVLWPKISAEPGLLRIYQDIEIPVREVLFRMERNGILIDSHLLARQSLELGYRLMSLEQEAYTLAAQPFNLNSPKQLAEILFVKLGLPIQKKTPSGAPSTDEEVLSELALDYPLPRLLLETRQLTKLKNTYTDKLPRMVNAHTGRVHTHFSQASVITGRLASSEPNLQNIPVRTAEGRRIRAAFIAPPDYKLIAADYSQIELRIMAHLSEDPRLLEAFALGEDVHRATAAEIFALPVSEVNSEQRRIAKTINFGLIYGMSAFGLARQLGLERSAAQAYIERYFARYPGVAQYMEATRNWARQNAYVETVFGRRLWLPDIHASQATRRQAAERAAINAPMQGSAADLIKCAMLAVQSWLDQAALHSRLVLQVHDELILEVPNQEVALVQETLPTLMTRVAQLKVPLVVTLGVGNNWDEAH